LRRLADRQAAGEILMTTTKRLLDFCRVQRSVRGSITTEGDWTHVHLASIDATETAAYAGLTIYVPNPRRARLFVNGSETDGFVANPPDATGRSSISLPWQRLEFPRS
jgi:hypothetical protein